MGDLLKIPIMVAVTCIAIIAICLIVWVGLLLQIKVLNWCDKADDWLYQRRKQKAVK